MSRNNDNYMVMVFCEIARRLPQTRSARPLVVEPESARVIFVGGAIDFEKSIDSFVWRVKRPARSAGANDEYFPV